MGHHEPQSPISGDGEQEKPNENKRETQSQQMEVMEHEDLSQSVWPCAITPTFQASDSAQILAGCTTRMLSLLSDPPSIEALGALQGLVHFVST